MEMMETLSKLPTMHLSGAGPDQVNIGAKSWYSNLHRGQTRWSTLMDPTIPWSTLMDPDGKTTVKTMVNPHVPTECHVFGAAGRKAGHRDGQQCIVNDMELSSLWKDSTQTCSEGKHEGQPSFVHCVSSRWCRGGGSNDALGAVVLGHVLLLRRAYTPERRLFC